ncbi:MAG: hypothetical protein ACRBB0_10210 [Pelagimonas sp.]|uniref:hypothetical protein n=1 Tax=Pelagimonas sp. TaxID=2073170 RepID=UPI003D6BACDE
MRKKRVALGGIAIFAAAASLPAYNYYALYRSKTEAFTEINFGKQEVYIIGQHATYMAKKLQEYSNFHGLDLVVFGPDDENEANTVLVSLYSFDAMDELPEHWQRCGDTCNEDTPGELYAASVSKVGLLARTWKITYIQMKPFAVGGTIKGEGFTCVMQLMALEAKTLFPNVSEDDFDTCRDLLSDSGGTTYRYNTSFNLLEAGTSF